MRPLDTRIDTTLFDITTTQPRYIFVADQPVLITRLEWRALLVMARRHREVASYIELSKEVFGDEVETDEDITSVIDRLRRIVNRAAHRLPQGWVTNIRGQGWMLSLPDQSIGVHEQCHDAKQLSVMSR